MISAYEMKEGRCSMDTRDLIKAGKLTEARQQIVDAVKTSPADTGKRTLLFQVHAFCGEWDKAERDLDLIAAQDAKREAGAQVYKNLVHAEKERLQVFKNGHRPSCMPETPPYAELYYAAREKLLHGEITAAVDLFDQVEAQIPRLSGTVNGRTFSGFKDTDAFTAYFLEAMVHERYLWIPFAALRELVITPPKTLFDLIWVSSRITTWEGLTMNCYLPVLYVDSFLHEDDRIKLGRMTDWTTLGGSFSKGAGQHVFQIGEEEIALLEIQEVLFNLPVTTEGNEK
jgi:type VI secretion system protein ImpE